MFDITGRKNTLSLREERSAPTFVKRKKKDISTTFMSGEREGREERMDGWTEEEEVRGEVVLLNLHNPPDSRGGQGGLSVVVRTTLDLATESQ